MAPLEHGATTGEEHTRNTRGSQATVGGEVDGHATGHLSLEGLHAAATAGAGGGGERPGGFRGRYTARWSVTYNRGGAYLKRAWLPRHATFGGKGGGHAAGGRPPRSIWF